MKPLFTDDDVAAADREVELALAARDGAIWPDAGPAPRQDADTADRRSVGFSGEDFLGEALEEALLDGMSSGSELHMVPEREGWVPPGRRRAMPGLESPLHLAWILAGCAVIAWALVGEGLSLGVWTTAGSVAAVSVLGGAGRAGRGLLASAMAVHAAAMALAIVETASGAGPGGVALALGGVAAAVSAYPARVA